MNNTCGSMEFHGIWATKPQVPWNSMEFCPDPKFHGITWNFFSILPSSMELHGISCNFLIFPKKVPWNYGNCMELDKFDIWKKIIFLNIVIGIWLMIICYLAKISQKRYILHWFQYRNSYFDHPSVSENGMLLYVLVKCLLIGIN